MLNYSLSFDPKNWNIVILYIMTILEKEFRQLKEEYILRSQNGEYINELEDIREMMRKNLRARTSDFIITGLDGNKYIIESDEVTDLYMIDGALLAKSTSEKVTVMGSEQKCRNTNTSLNPCDVDK